VNSETETEVEKHKPKEESYEDTIKALTAQLKEYATAYTARWSRSNQNQDTDKTYAWKRIPPKDGEPSVKKMYYIVVFPLKHFNYSIYVHILSNIMDYYISPSTSPSVSPRKTIMSQPYFAHP
jgi:hypothetical protein